MENIWGQTMMLPITSQPYQATFSGQTLKTVSELNFNSYSDKSSTLLHETFFFLLQLAYSKK